MTNFPIMENWWGSTFPLWSLIRCISSVLKAASVFISQSVISHHWAFARALGLRQDQTDSEQNKLVFISFPLLLDGNFAAQITLQLHVCVLQVAEPEPGSHLAVQRLLAEGQIHGRPAPGPHGAAQTRQRQRAVIARLGFSSFLICSRKVCNKEVFHVENTVDGLVDYSLKGPIGSTW